ncbi:hypothetical protein LZ198_12820 [Myxococcus sp. K15C18031901]|uniref:hypothetical protein n=1 Tax=Myxococcus dinghuensis TaxID=2906761 RepID=UPI0020A7933D|nr:hypothetical protein [Myxococcus dinghuensis]MCP3099750.1 hypothetical protein [Myxococcus dinghuensis]
MTRRHWGLGAAMLALAGMLAAWPGPRDAPHDVAAHEAHDVPSPPLTPTPVRVLAAPPPGADTARPQREPALVPQVLPTEADTSEVTQVRPRRGASEERQRVVQALRSARAPDVRRETVLSVVRASGESQAAWTGQARAALETWRRRVEEEVLPVQAEPPHCFAAGCVARVTFPDKDSFEASFRRTPEWRLGAPGAHLQLPPERLTSGEVIATWLVLPPDAP